MDDIYIFTLAWLAILVVTVITLALIFSKIDAGRIITIATAISIILQSLPKMKWLGNGQHPKKGKRKRKKE